MEPRVGIEDLLAWYRDAGVDEPLADASVDRYRQTEAAAAERIARREAARAARKAPAQTRLPSARTPTGTTRAPLSDAAATALGEEAAAACDDLAALRDALEGFDASSLRERARNTVFAAGDPTAPLMIMGDVPDDAEDASGQPFAGPAGDMLDRMLGAIGTKRDAAYLAAAAPWRTPGRRELSPRDTALLAPFAQRHVALAKPSVLLVMGATAARFLFGAGKALPALRKGWQSLAVDGAEVPALVTFHPNFLLRQPAQKRLVWMDLLRLKERLGSSL